MRALLMTALLTLVAGPAVADVTWREDTYDRVLADARAANRHVFIDFYATWCGPCKQLEAVTYPDKDVSALLNAMLPMKIDAEKGAGIELAKQYKVRAYPTLVVIGPDGKEVDRHIGYLGPEDFTAVIGGYTRGEGTLAALLEESRTRPDDFDLLFRIGMKHADAGRAGDAAAVFARAMALDPKNEKGRNAEMLFAVGAANYNDERYADARPYFERVVTEYAGSDWHRDGLKRLAATEYKLGNSDAAVATYWKATEDRQTDPGALNGFAWFCAQRKIGLDQALPAALKAVELSNRDAGIIDTLAEVYFARADYDNAIKSAEEALAKEPNDPYYKDQVAKFKKAKADADQASR